MMALIFRTRFEILQITNNNQYTFHTFFFLFVGDVPPTFPFAQKLFSESRFPELNKTTRRAE